MNLCIEESHYNYFDKFLPWCSLLNFDRAVHDLGTTKKLRACLVWFQIYWESKTFQIQPRNDSHLKQNHFRNCLTSFLVLVS
jgi:hypothetical protein